MTTALRARLMACCAVVLALHSANAQRAAVTYTVRFPALGEHVAQVTAAIPTDGRASVELMMPTWSPGYYKVENYADRVQELAARSDDGQPLDVVHSARNRWRIATPGLARVVVSYRVLADQRFVTADWVGDSLVLLNGAPTFVTLVEQTGRPAEVRLQLPAGWTSATSLDSIADGVPDHYRAADYDELVDSPIVAGGDLRIRAFDVGGSRHAIVDAGEMGAWDGARAAGDIARFVAEDRAFWGTLPYRHYVFLDLFRRGGGGLEHARSTLLTSNATRAATPAAYLGWLNFVSHEYFHAMNVKRLRPIELGPFDYESAPRTPSLWISEGLTTYYGNLTVVRAGLAGQDDFLAGMSTLISQLQNTPGRLVQPLSQSSLDVWASENSAVGMDRATTVSYYTKGPIVGLLLDARIRRLTNGRKSLDDVMRLAYRRYAGARGFTPAQFRQTASEVAGVSLADFFRRALDTTEELDYGEALDWYGLQFAGGDDATARWQLTPLPNASAAQRAHLAALVAPDTR